MLQNLQIKNFQSHEDSFIEFSPGVTLITGTSNHGKTAILRALNWIVSNRPLGDSFIRHGEDCCDTILSTDEATVRRIRSDKENVYVFGSPNQLVTDDADAKIGGVFTTFSALGSSVPEEVTKALNIQTINIQQQLDPYFLVLDSPGKVGSYFNGIIHLDEVEQVVDEISRRMRSEVGSIEDLKESIKENDQKIAFYESLCLEEFESNLRIYDNFQKVLGEGRTKIKRLFVLIRELCAVEKELVDIPDIEPFLEQAKDIPVEISKMQESIKRLSWLLTDLDKLDYPLLAMTEDGFQLAEESEGLQSCLIEKDKAQDKLFLYLEDLKKIEKDEKELLTEIETTMSLRQELLEQVTVCPYCETELDGQHKELLLGKEKIDVF